MATSGGDSGDAAMPSQPMAGFKRPAEEVEVNGDDVMRELSEVDEDASDAKLAEIARRLRAQRRTCSISSNAPHGAWTASGGEPVDRCRR